MDTTKTCTSRYEFRAPAMKDHPLNGKTFTCEREAPHPGVNHTAHAGDTEVNWTNEQAMEPAA